MKKSLVFLLAGLSFLLVSRADAADLGVGLRAGTYGLGAEFGAGITPWFGLRATASTLSVSQEFEEDGVEYDGDLELGGYGLMADFFPMKGTFRLTVGVLSNRNEIGLNATPTGPEEIGDTEYTAEQIGTLSGKVAFDSTAPYLGVGWGNIARGNRVGFLCDIGVIRQGMGDVTLASTGIVDAADLAIEEANIEDEIKDYEFWPVVSFGISFRF